MKTLILKKIAAAMGGEWPDNDYVVFDGGKVIGRIMLQAPQGQPWFWTITSLAHPPSVHNRGYSANREQAMVDFKAGGRAGFKELRNTLRLIHPLGRTGGIRGAGRVSCSYSELRAASPSESPRRGQVRSRVQARPLVRKPTS
jgi:hypothetical protein